MTFRLHSWKTLCFAGCCILASQAPAQQFQFKADLDPFIFLPGAYQLGPEKVEELFPRGSMSKNPNFQWLTSDHSRAIFKRRPAGNVETNLTLLKGTVPVQEMIVDFLGGKFLGATVSVFNRGDGGTMSKADFDKAFMSLGKHLGEQLQTRPRRREGNIKRGILTSGYIWISDRGMAVLEHNPEAGAGGDIEFLRLRLCQRNAGGAYAAAMDDRNGATVRTPTLVANVKREANGNVFISHIPMVDQGGKGYCVVASVQRLFEYYGVPCDMHQLAQIAQSDPEAGTSTAKTNAELGAIDHLFKMRYECLVVNHEGRLVEPFMENDQMYIRNNAKSWDAKDFGKTVRKYVDAGIPLLWSLQVGRFKEEPPLSEQTSGGHMRLIIGYNDQQGKLLFSDSWGAGHELKSMSEGDARSATTGLFLMKPVTN